MIDVAVLREKRVIFRFITEHRVELLVDFNVNPGRQFFRQIFLKVVNVDLLGRHEIDSVGIDFNHLRSAFALANRSSSSADRDRSA